MRPLIAPTLALVLVVIAQHASALGCDVKEYAQYKDQVRNRDSRNQLALDYCLNAKLRSIRDSYAEPCRREMAKQLDALSSVKATAAIKYAIGGCQGQPPK